MELNKKWLLRGVAALMVLALVGAACSTDSTQTASDIKSETPRDE